MRSISKNSIFCSIIGLGLATVVLFNACKKEVNPALSDGRQEVEFNFFPASDVIRTAYGISNQIFTSIYVDKYIEKPVNPPSELSAFPTFQYDQSGIIHEYPDVLTQSSGAGVVTYTHYDAGGHRLMFTDINNTVVLDTTIVQPTKSKTCLYFTDAPAAVNAPAAYKLVAVQEQTPVVPANQIAVRFIHLSADAGALTCHRFKTDGSLVNALPGDLHFGEASPYEYFAAADTVAGLLRFTLDNPANGASVSTGVPYGPGRSYVIAIIGFRTDQQRQIAPLAAPVGPPINPNVSVAANLRAVLRRTH